MRKNKAMLNKRISIIIPTYNEGKYVGDCLNSLTEQTFDLKNAEVFIVDGNSNDDTLKVVKTFEEKLPLKIFFNEKRKATYALNTGIKHSAGDYIIRLDAHSVYEKDYLERCVFYLDNTDAMNVGGVAITKGRGLFGNINADILSSKFGVGNSKFRTDSKSGYVDTVPFGAFKREVFEKVGYFNEKLSRSEDNDINSRIRKSGGKVYLASDIRFTYYCRNTFLGLILQALKNGNALAFTLKENRCAMSFRHFIPLMFFLSLAVLVPMSFFWPFAWYILLSELVIYSSVDLFFSIFHGKKSLFLFKFVIYPLFHLSYGLGSFLSFLGIKLY